MAKTTRKPAKKTTARRKTTAKRKPRRKARVKNSACRTAGSKLRKKRSSSAGKTLGSYTCRRKKK